MELPSLPDVSTLTNFPIPECNWLEFKGAPTQCTMNKIPATICAFLNSNGGYIIVGVEDGTLSILGVSVQDYDRMALYVDNIYRSRSVQTIDGKVLPLNTVVVSELVARDGKRLAVIAVRPEKDMKYKLKKHNEMYYRLSASNFRYSLEKEMYTKEEMEYYATKRVVAFQHVADQNSELSKKLTEDYNQLLEYTRKIQTEFRKISHEVEEHRGKAKELEEKVQTTNAWLRKSILAQKEIAEQELKENSKESLLKTLGRLLCFL